MKISDLLKSKGGDVVTIRPDATVSDLLALLNDHGIGAVVVSDDGQSIAGIVSERDIVRHLHQTGAELVGAPVSQIMTSEVQTCEPGHQIADIESTMTQGRFRHLPVIVDDKLAGIVSIGDVVKGRIASLQDERDQLEGYIHQ
ncbi:CBS domain-containing protein [Actinomycetota bacterium]